MKKQSVAVGVGFLLLLVPLLVAAALAFSGANQLSQIAPAPEPVLMSVSESEFDLAEEASLLVSFGGTEQIVASGANGIVTAVGLVVGQMVEAGTIIYEVDGVGVIAYSGTQTFFRTLSWGDSGDDVEALQHLLNESPILAGLEADGYFGADTADAVWALQSHLGVAEATGVFSPHFVVRIPGHDFVPSKVLIEQGRSALPLGEPIAESNPRAEMVSVQVDPSRSNAQFVFSSSGKKLPLASTDDGWEEISVNDAKEMLKGVIPNEEGLASVDGRLALLEPEFGVVVPASAIVSDGAGATCIHLADSNAEGGFASLPVRVVGTTVTGSAIIEDRVDSEALALANPAWMGVTDCR